MTNHTPGPWKAAHRQGADGNYRTEVFSDEYGGIATCDWTKKHCGNGVTKTYREANARLIAAAPDLLESLQQFVIIAQEIHDHWDKDRDTKVGKYLMALSGYLPGYDKRIDELRAAMAKATGETA